MSVCVSFVSLAFSPRFSAIFSSDLFLLFEFSSPLCTSHSPTVHLLGLFLSTTYLICLYFFHNFINRLSSHVTCVTLYPWCPLYTLLSCFHPFLSSLSLLIHTQYLSFDLSMITFSFVLFLLTFPHPTSYHSPFSHPIPFNCFTLPIHFFP